MIDAHANAFHQHFDGSIRDLLQDLDGERRRVLLRISLWWALILPLGVGALFLGGLWHADSKTEETTFIAMLVALGWSFWHYYDPYRSAFKARLVAPLIRAYNKDFVYDANGSINRKDFATARLFREHATDALVSEDVVTGRIGRTSFRFGEVDARYVTQRTRSGKKTRRETTFFRGLFFVADFNKHFKGETYVLPDRAERWFGRFGKSLQSVQKRYDEVVRLEDPEFEKLFKVCGTHQIEARYILSAALMQRISEFRLRSGYKMRLGFVNDRLYLAIHTGDLFEPRLLRSIANPKLYRQFWDDIALFSGIVEDLNLNTRIWSKA